MPDLSKNFYTGTEQNSFLDELNLTPHQKEILLSKKNEIADILRKNIADFTGTNAGGGKRIIPKFVPQGSWTYKTINQPCYKPPQQIDFDLGVYLPRSYLEKEKPNTSSDEFFKIVDSTLIEYARNNGYKHSEKKTCARVVINSEVHIDIPLYVIGDSQFSHLAKSAASRGVTALDESTFMDSTEWKDFFEFTVSQTWEELDEDKVWLATRKEGWIESDPRKLYKWFLNAVDEKGEQLKRICRYLKSWRDCQWEKGGPSSIFLMICVEELFKKIPKRDDLSLLEICEKLPSRLYYPVFNPTDEDEGDLRDRLEDNTIGELQEKIQEFANDLSDAIYRTPLQKDACELVTRHLGQRFPMNSTSAKSNTREKVLATAAISASVSEVEAMPKRTKAG